MEYAHTNLKPALIFDMACGEYLIFETAISDMKYAREVIDQGSPDQIH
jgi:hypothetical protein